MADPQTYFMADDEGEALDAPVEPPPHSVEFEEESPEESADG